MSVNKKKPLATLLFLLTLSVPLLAQDYEQRYNAAKQLFTQKNYGAAINAFKPLIVYNQANPYIRCASFYYAAAAYHEGLLGAAKDMFLQLRKMYPQWTQWNEVNYWLAKIYFDRRQYFQAMHMLKGCKGEGMQESAALLKTHYLSQIKDIETLSMLLEEYADDSIVAQLLVDAIAHGDSSERYAQLSDSLCAAFGLGQHADVAPLKRDVVFKNRYTVSLLFPFLVASLAPTLAPKINQNVLDLYSGIAMANDTLEKQGIYIDLQLFDTQRLAAVTARLLSGENIKKSDLLVGPLFPNQIALAQQFSHANHISMINPVSGNEDFLNTNPYAMLYLPSYRTIGMRSAEWLYTHTNNKKCIVFFDEKSKNAALVKGFLERAGELGLVIEMLESVSAKHADELFNVLTMPTQFDDMDNAIEFEIKKDSIGSIFVASDNPLIYTKVISAVDTRGDSIIILGNQSWLHNEVASFETNERLHITMAAPNIYLLSNPNYKEFEQAFIRKYGTVPSEYAKTGYEFMLFVGNCFDKYGVHFQERLRKQEFVEGHISNGYSYKDASSNQLVPFVYFKNGELVLSD